MRLSAIWGVVCFSGVPHMASTSPRSCSRALVVRLVIVVPSTIHAMLTLM
ncbi:MAG: hypothetical protein U9R79_08915 [Armatimonadota bacterium]|nr:hypothetical protein [Armatimonadota bacterium]